jgi:hypothetical protein
VRSGNRRHAPVLLEVVLGLLVARESTTTTRTTRRSGEGSVFPVFRRSTIHRDPPDRPRRLSSVFGPDARG